MALLAGVAIVLAVAAQSAGQALAAPRQLGLSGSPNTGAVASPLLQLSVDDERCLNCHDRGGLDFVLPSGETLDTSVEGAAYEGSVHGRAGVTCTSCHTGIGDYPHPELEADSLRELTIELNAVCDDCHDHQGSALLAGAHGGETAGSNLEAPVCSDCHGAHQVEAPQEALVQVSMCQGCHQVPDFRASVHGQALTAGTDFGPTCSSCHGAHTIAPAEVATSGTCRGCHDEEADLYDQSVHGAARSAGDVEAATCSDCHGPAHEVVGTTDPNSSTYPLRLPQTCGRCHGDPELTGRLGLPNVYEEYVDSIHGLAISEAGLLVSATCSECHGSHDIMAHDDFEARVFPSNVIATCGQCHAGVVDEYLGSVHGRLVAQGDLRAAVCTDCHGAHGLAGSDEPEWMLEVIEECGSCHEESLTTYRDTFHGQVTALGFSRVARCSDCHGSHEIQQTDHAASAVSDENRVETCAQCHEGASENFAEFSPHADADDRARDPLLYYTKRFMELLILSVLGFFLLHTVLWAVRSSVDRVRNHQAAPGSTATRET